MELEKHPDGNKLRSLLDSFQFLLRQKGYRWFRVTAPKSLYTNSGESLQNYLKHVLLSHLEFDAKQSQFKIETYLEFIHADNCIHCEINLELDNVKGFKIKEYTITQKPSGETKRFRLDHNNQIPGVNAVLSMFPKPKPWENILKGKFKL